MKDNIINRFPTAEAENFVLELVCQHWSWKIDQNRWVWLTLDRADAPVNSLNKEILAELDEFLNHIGLMQPIALIINSAKSNGFVAGADITQFVHAKNVDQCFEIMRQAQNVFDKLSKLNFPTIAIIHGFCLGGGLELALACRFRIAIISTEATFGTPEVQLGLHPGWGGTIRLPRLIGISKAMMMMLGGKSFRAIEAQNYGLINQLVESKEIENSIRILVKGKNASARKNKIALFHYSMLRRLTSIYFYLQLQSKVNKYHYPAPFVIIDNWQRDGALDENKSYIHEAKTISCLMVSNTSRQLVRLFLLRGKMKSLARGAKKKFRQVHLVGCGSLGTFLALKAAEKGLIVTLQDVKPEKADLIRKLARDRKKKNHSSSSTALYEQLIIDDKGDRIREADIIIEAVNDDLKLKQEIIASVNQRKQANALVLTTSSSFSLSEISNGLLEPYPLIGFYLNPYFLNSELVEISYCHQLNAIQSQQNPSIPVGFQEAGEARALSRSGAYIEYVSSEMSRQQSQNLKGDGYINEAASFAIQLGYLPVLSRASSSFLISTLLPYLIEAMFLIDEKIAPLEIDRSMLHFGMEMGPIAMIDQIGLDTCAILAQKSPHYAQIKLPRSLVTRISDGFLGVKSGEGFYRYPFGNQKFKIKSKASVCTANIIERLVPFLINSAVDSLAEQWVDNSDLLDAAMVYGGCFPRFRGGPLTYTKNYGREAFYQLIKRFSLEKNNRLKLSSGWENFYE